jgi:hypothetical protein
LIRCSRLAAFPPTSAALLANSNGINLEVISII